MRAAFLLFLAVFSSLAQTYRVDTVAGTGAPGLSGDGAAATRAQLNEPAGLAIDRSGRLYIADRGNGRIRSVEADGRIRTLIADIDQLRDIAVNAAEELYFTDGFAVRRIARDGTLSVFAVLEGAATIAISPDGVVFAAEGNKLHRVAADGSVSLISDLGAPVSDIALGEDGNLIVVAGERVVRIARDGTATPMNTAAEAGAQIAVDRWGDVYLAASRIVKLVGGTPFEIGSAASAAGGLAVSAAGDVFVAETGSHRVRALIPPRLNAPIPIVPSQNATDVPVRTSLRWSVVPGAASYQVFFGTSPSNLARVATTEGTTYAPENLTATTTYYWHIVTRVGPLPPIAGPVQSFTTGTPGRSPEIPRSPSPFDGAIGLPQVLSLQWQTSGALGYELYLGTSTNPGRVAVLDESGIVAPGLRPETTYYWRVVAFNSSGTVSSPVWRFTTGPTGGYPFVVQTVAGTALPTEDGTPASAAIIESPRTPGVDGPGHVYFIEAGRRVRRIGLDGKLSTVYAPTAGPITGLAVQADSTLYVATADHVVRITRAGQRSIHAGQPGTPRLRG